MISAIFYIYLSNQELILKCMSIWMIFIGILTFIALLKKEAPYGRYSDNKFGILIPAKIAWFIQELPSFIISILFIFYNLFTFGCNWSCFILGLFSLHYFQRGVIYPLIIKNGSATPLVPCFLAFVFCTYNGLMQSLSLALMTDSRVFDYATFGGIVIFTLGMCMNIYSDHQLRQLRSSGDFKIRYKIPTGGMFQFVSCANYLGEILEWVGYCVASQTSASLAFAVFTCANLVPRAISHHKWYRQKFEDYPKNRKAIIPFIL